MRKTLLLCFISIFPIFAHAAEDEYIREYTYTATEFDTKYTSRVQALDGVKQALIEELGVFVQSVVRQSEDSEGNSSMSHDVVTLTAGIVRTTVLDEKWDGASYYIKAKIKADQQEVKTALKALQEDQKLEEALRNSQTQLASARTKIENLQSELKKQKDASVLAKLNSDYVSAARDLEVEYEFQRAMQAKVEGKFKESFEILTRLADKNYAAAQSRLGHSYERGLATEIDYHKAVEWYLKSIKNGYPTAFSRLGFIYERGLGVRQNYRKALELYEKGVELGSADAMSRLGWMYQTGLGVDKDIKKAVALYEQSIKNHQHGRGYARIGFLYEKGIDVEQDYTEAALYYQKAIERGNPFGSGRLAWLYVKGKGVDENYAKAKELALYASKYNNPQGLVVMGYLYENGLEVDQDLDLAVDYYRKAAKQGSRSGMFRLGHMYHKGKGVMKDKYEAAKWYRKAADLGHRKAAKKLEKMTRKGVYDCC